MQWTREALEHFLDLFNRHEILVYPAVGEDTDGVPYRVRMHYDEYAPGWVELKGTMSRE